MRACLGTAFPYRTFIINITGSIVMGLIAGYLAFKGEASQPWRLFLMTGILGGYTTFSAFSLDTALLYERGEIGLALFYVLGSVVLSIAGLFAGLALVRHLSVDRQSRMGIHEARMGLAAASVCIAWPARLSRVSLITRQTHSLVRTPLKRSGACRRRRGGRAASRRNRKPIGWSMIMIGVLVAVSADAGLPARRHRRRARKS